VLALRSDGSWSEGVIGEVLSDKLTVMMPAGTKQIRKIMAHKLLKKAEAAVSSSEMELQSALRKAALDSEAQNAQRESLAQNMQSQEQQVDLVLSYLCEGGAKQKPKRAPEPGAVKSSPLKVMASIAEECLSDESTEGVSDKSRTTSIASLDSELQQLTTVMMRNIPINLSRCRLLALLNEHGFEGHYDFIHLPVDLQKRVGIGYAFINFVSHECAVAFSQHFNGFTSWKAQTEKVCQVTWSDALQGLSDHVERCRNSSVMHESLPEEFKPALFENGVQVLFPAPTKKLRTPRPWSRRH
jgi:hypothetical protein